MLVEKEELDLKIHALGKYLESTDFQMHPADVREELVAQHCAMQSYSEVLAKRIKRF